MENGEIRKKTDTCLYTIRMKEQTFQVRSVKFYKSALTWQIGEDIISISKCEFDRCKIPRLVLERKE